MTNVSGSSAKVRIRKRLFEIGMETLRGEGWTVERIPRLRKSSVRRIRKGNVSKTVAIRTTQDTYISFPRNDDDSAWVTLSDVDAVMAVSVDDGASPKYALVHMIDGNEMRDRFDRAYAARRAAGHRIPIGRGVWLPLYLPDAASPPSQVGGGAGLANRELARVRLQPQELREAQKPAAMRNPFETESGAAIVSETHGENGPLTIAEAKRRLALHLGVDSSSIRITVEA
jgi:hypothetical protein